MLWIYVKLGTDLRKISFQSRLHVSSGEENYSYHIFVKKNTAIFPKMFCDRAPRTPYNLQPRIACRTIQTRDCVASDSLSAHVIDSAILSFFHEVKARRVIVKFACLRSKITILLVPLRRKTNPNYQRIVCIQFVNLVSNQPDCKKYRN